MWHGKECNKITIYADFKCLSLNKVMFFYVFVQKRNLTSAEMLMFLYETSNTAKFPIETTFQYGNFELEFTQKAFLQKKCPPHKMPTDNKFKIHHRMNNVTSSSNNNKKDIPCNSLHLIKNSNHAVAIICLCQALWLSFIIYFVVSSSGGVWFKCWCARRKNTDDIVGIWMETMR